MDVSSVADFNDGIGKTATCGRRDREGEREDEGRW